jgi:DNA repair protein RadC
MERQTVDFYNVSSAWVNGKLEYTYTKTKTVNSSLRPNTQVSERECMNEVMRLVVRHLRMDKLKKERGVLVSIDDNNVIREIVTFAYGNEWSVLFSMRAVHKMVLKFGIKNYILIHNHPNNVLRSSVDDRETCEGFQVFSEIINTNFSGDYVITESGYLNVGTNESVPVHEYIRKRRTAIV